MIGAFGIALVVLSVFWLPHGLTVALALAFALVEPLAPLVAGILIDLLTYSSAGYTLPWYSVLGALAALAAFALQARLTVPRYRL